MTAKPRSDQAEEGRKGRDQDAGAWVSLRRYLSARRAEDAVSVLRKKKLKAQSSPEGSAEAELHRVRVREGDVDAAALALLEDAAADLPFDPEPHVHSGGPLGALKRRGHAARLMRAAERASAEEDDDALVEALWECADCAPDEIGAVRDLVDLLVDRGGRANVELARFKLERIQREQGSGPVATSLAAIALAEGETDEAEAWLDEAGRSGAEEAEIAFMRCLLAFSSGDAKSLTRSATAFRSACGEIPDQNWVEVAVMLAGAGDSEKALRMLGKALRAAEDIDEDAWGEAAALRVAIDAEKQEGLDELAEILGADEATELVDEAGERLAEARREFKRAGAAKKDRPGKDRADTGKPGGRKHQRKRRR